MRATRLRACLPLLANEIRNGLIIQIAIDRVKYVKRQPKNHTSEGDACNAQMHSTAATGM
jgi:hypothetical protein